MHEQETPPTSTKPVEHNSVAINNTSVNYTRNVPTNEENDINEKNETKKYRQLIFLMWIPRN